MTALFVLDADANPVAADPATYGIGLLDRRRLIGDNTLRLPSGYIRIRTEFVGLDFDGSGRLWQSIVEWADMNGTSTSTAHWPAEADARSGHADLLNALEIAASAINNPPQP